MSSPQRSLRRYRTAHDASVGLEILGVRIDDRRVGMDTASSIVMMSARSGSQPTSIVERNEEMRTQ